MDRDAPSSIIRGGLGGPDARVFTPGLRGLARRESSAELELPFAVLCREVGVGVVTG